MYPEKIHLALGNLDNWCFGQFYHSKIEKLTLVCLSFSRERLNFELKSARTIGIMSRFIGIRMLAFIYRSCLRDGCDSTEHK